MNGKLTQGFEVVDYTPPKWTNALARKPNKIIKLCQLPTPIHEFKVPGLPENVEMFIKRDDMTGGIIGGNKHRKMEYLMADAIDKGCNAVVTAGTDYSSHCMATATVAKMLGLECYVILYTVNKNERRSKMDLFKTPGLFLPTLLCSKNVYNMDKMFYLNSNFMNITNGDMIRQLEKETGKKIYPIPVGGSHTHISLYAHFQCWEEMMSQGMQDRFDDVAITWGSGGSALALAIANFLTGSKLKVHGISINKSSDTLFEETQHDINEIGLDAKVKDIINIIDIHDSLGYRNNKKKDYDFIADVSAETGILCDRVYVGKALKEIVYLLNNDPQQFKGHRILFIHTGGMVGLYDGTLATTLEKLYNFKVKDLPTSN